MTKGNLLSSFPFQENWKIPTLCNERSKGVISNDNLKFEIIWEFLNYFAFIHFGRKGWRCIENNFHLERSAILFPGAPFGFKHVPSVFQKVMQEIFRGLESFVFVYIDDIVIFSTNVRDHYNHIKIIISRLNKWNLRLQIFKCLFFASELIVLGYRINRRGIQVAKEKLVAIRNWPEPTEGKQIKQQLVFFNYFRKLIPMYSTLFPTSSSIPAIMSSSPWLHSLPLARVRRQQQRHQQHVLFMESFVPTI